MIMPITSREKILNSAKTVFIERGKDGARVDNIAQIAGVNKAMIYYYFSSKDQLYYQVLKNTFQQIMTQIWGALELVGPPAKRFTVMVEAYHEFLQENKDIPKMILRELADNAPVLKQVVGEVIKSDDKGIHFRFKETLEQGQQENSFRDVPSWHTLVNLLGMIIFPYIASPLMENIMGSKINAAFWKDRPQAVIDQFLHGIQIQEAP
jgi:TetR/AcrR family transcriptional regulator